MNDSLTEDSCFLCGCDAKSRSYDRGKGKAFIDCTNKACGEYLITYSAMRHLTNGERKKAFSKMATPKEEIQDRKEILVISYHGGIQARFRPLKDLLSDSDINFFGFRKSEF